MNANTYSKGQYNQIGTNVTRADLVTVSYAYITFWIVIFIAYTQIKYRSSDTLGDIYKIIIVPEILNLLTTL